MMFAYNLICVVFKGIDHKIDCDLFLALPGEVNHGLKHVKGNVFLGQHEASSADGRKGD